MKPYQTPELTLETRLFALTLFVIIVGVLVFKLGFEVDQLDRRMVVIETAIRNMGKLHEIP